MRQPDADIIRYIYVTPVTPVPLHSPAQFGPTCECSRWQSPSLQKRNTDQLAPAQCWHHACRCTSCHSQVSARHARQPPTVASMQPYLGTLRRKRLPLDNPLDKQRVSACCRSRLPAPQHAHRSQLTRPRHISSSVRQCWSRSYASRALDGCPEGLTLAPKRLACEGGSSASHCPAAISRVMSKQPPMPTSQAHSVNTVASVRQYLEAPC